MSTPLSSVMTRAGWIACGAAALAAVVVINTAAPVVSALFTRTEAPASKSEETKQAADRFKASTETQIASIKGRSLFFIPPPKPQPRVDPPPRVAEKPVEPPKPTLPTRYGGPSIQAVVNGTVWFTDGKKVAVGESSGSGSSAVAVIAADSPWAIRLKWEGVEFDVPLFERDAVIYPVKKPDSHSADPKIEHKAEATVPKPDAKPETKPPATPEAKPGDKPADSAGTPDKVETHSAANDSAPKTPSNESAPAAEPAKKKDEAPQ